MNPDLGRPNIQKKKSPQKHLIPFLLMALLGGAYPKAEAQNRVLDVGIRVQKTVNLYYENGITLQYSDDALVSERLYFGLSYVSSRLGSAMGSNAIKQDNFLLSASYLLRPGRLLRPLFSLHTGYFRASIGEPIFENIPNSSLLLSPGAGISLDPENPFKLSASLGYNLITGDGTKGPGTLYPVFLQTSLSRDIFQLKSIRK